MRLHRRAFLAASAAGLATAGLLPRRPAAQDIDRLRIQLNWIANVQYSDHWIGLEDGLFAANGVEITYSPGGPNTPDPLVMVAAGDADVGFTSWLPFLDAVARGNDFVLISASFQTSPLGIISLPASPILSPEDIVGKRILAQGPNELTAIQATLALAGLPNEWDMVPAGFSPEPLVAGDGDGYTAFGTNQTIALEQMGLVRDRDFFFRSFDELGFPSYASLAFTSRGVLEAKRPAIVGYVRTLMQGWIANENDVAYGARLATETYGVDYALDYDQQLRQNELQLTMIRPDLDPGYPILTLDPEKMAGPMYDAARATGRTDLPDVHAVADFAIGEEAFGSL